MTSKSMRVKRDVSLSIPSNSHSKPQIGVKGIAALSDLRNSRVLSHQRKIATD